ncbi:hypothetical protein EBU95_19235 [bacterium]|nr:hypothetical protein [bacterium]
MLLFKKDIKYSLDGKTIEKHIFKSGEEYSLDSVLNALGKSNLDFFIQKSLIEVKKQEEPTIQNIEIDLKSVNTTQIEADTQDAPSVDTSAQDNTQPHVFEIMYKTTQPIQDKDGNEIEVGSQFTESELKELIVVDQRKSNKKIKELLQDEKLIETKKLAK